MTAEAAEWRAFKVVANTERLADWLQEVLEELWLTHWDLFLGFLRDPTVLSKFLGPPQEEIQFLLVKQ